MKLKYLLIAMFLIILPNIVAEPQVTIKLYDKQIYTLGSEIFIHTTIKNDTTETISFSLADDRIHNIKFDVKTPQNINVLPSFYSIKHLTTAHPIYYKKIALSANEEFSFVTLLNDFIDFREAGKYFIRAYFYLDFHNPDIVIESNEISLVIAQLERPQKKEVITIEEPDILTRTLTNPEDVIKYMIKARQDSAKEVLISELKLPPGEIASLQKKHWDRFFLYLDIESLYLKNNKRKAKYLRLSEFDRSIKLDEYKEKLIEADEDREIILIPSNFEITKTIVANDNASVRVVQTFTYPTFVEKKVFVYYLKKDGSSWEIYNYEVIPHIEGL